jgi:hypothetical protein
VSFNRLLAAPPAKAAQAVIIMSHVLVNEPTVSPTTRELARKLLDVGVEELAERIWSARRPDRPSPKNA